MFEVNLVQSYGVRGEFGAILWCLRRICGFSGAILYVRGEFVVLEANLVPSCGVRGEIL